MSKVSITDLQKWNKLEGTALDIGQKLIVKKGEEETQRSSVEQSENVSMKKGGTHIVQTSETLYSLSRKYNVSIDDLKKWNDLIGDDISIGQELIVTPGAKIREEVRTDTKASKAPDTKEVIDEKVEKVTQQPTNTQTQKPISQTNFEEIVESGTAELIEGTQNTRKYLALHRTAKIGTIMRVKNEMNDQEVFVRVLGRLPDTGTNKNVLIKISKSAYDRLGAIDKKFRVKVSYIP